MQLGSEYTSSNGTKEEGRGGVVIGNTVIACSIAYLTLNRKVADMLIKRTDGKIVHT
jgi:hypothetical protein